MPESDARLRQRFFYSIKGHRHGPVSAAELKRLAAAGAISPADLIWKDGSEKKLQAAKVKGLFPERPTASITPNASGTRHATTRSQVDRSASAIPPRSRDYLPRIRVTYVVDVFKRGFLSLFHGYQIVGLFHDRLVVARSVRYPRLQEEQCTEKGFAEYLATCAFTKTIPLSTITKAAFHGDVRRSFLGKRYPDSLVQLRIQKHRGSTRLFFARRDVPNLYASLQGSLRDRLEPAVRWRSTGPGLILCFFLFLMLLIVSAVAVEASGLRPHHLEFLGDLGVPVFWITTAALSALTVFVIKRLLRRDLTKKMPMECLFAPTWPPPKPTGSRVRQPYRSTVVGFGLKLIGFAWLLAVIFILPRMVQSFVMPSSTSSQSPDFYMGTAVAFWSIPSVLLLYVGHGLARASAKSGRDADARRHILYLRSFSLDGKTTLQPNSALAAFMGVSGAGSLKAWFTDVLNGMNLVANLKFIQCMHPLRLTRIFFGIVADSTEQSLVRYFSPLGPVCAIGKPGERIAETGAFREYVADDVWQGAVLHYLRDCQAVLIQPSQSGGMEWELETVFTTMALEKVLITFAGWEGMASDYEDLRIILEPMLNTRLPRCVPYRGLPVVMWFEQNGTVRWTEVSYRSPASWLFTGDAVDLEYTLRPFVQGLHGGDRELPRPIRKPGLHHYAAAWFFVALWLIGFGACINPSLFRASTPVYAQSRSRTIKGTAFPYAVDIPESWIERIVSENSWEHEFAKPDVGRIVIVAHPGQADLNRLPEEIAASTKQQLGALGRDVVVELVQRKSIGNRSCAEIRLRNEYVDGRKEHQRVIAYSGVDGSFSINIVTVEGIGAEQQTEIDRILGSVRFDQSAPQVKAANPRLAARQFREAPESGIRMLRGKAVRYEFRVPLSWKLEQSNKELVEHVYKLPSGGAFAVVAHAEKEDFSNSDKELLDAEQTNVGKAGDVRLQSKERVDVSGVSFVRVNFVAHLPNGKTTLIWYLLHSGDAGTLLLKVVVDGNEESEVDRAILEEVFSSIRFRSP